MSKRITITCPVCSATLAAPVSAVGRTLLCPKCQTGIPVQEPTNHTLASLAGKAGDVDDRKDQLTKDTAQTRRRMLRNVKRLVLLLTFGMAVLLTITILINTGTKKSRTSPPQKSLSRSSGMMILIWC